MLEPSKDSDNLDPEEVFQKNLGHMETRMDIAVLSGWAGLALAVLIAGLFLSVTIFALWTGRVPSWVGPIGSLAVGTSLAMLAVSNAFLGQLREVAEGVRWMKDRVDF